MQKRSLPIAVSAGGPGWGTRRDRVFRVVGLLAAVLILAVAVATWDDEPAAAAGAAAIAALLLALLTPARRPTGAPYDVVEDGKRMVAIPMRPVTLRGAIALSAVGLLILVGSGAGAWRALPDNPVQGIAVVLFGGAMGLVIGGLGLVNLLPKARRPKPILLSDTAVGWLFGGKRQWAGWEEVAAVEPWWTPIGFGIFRPTANHILLRGHDGELVTSFRVSLLAVGPELALSAVREAHAAASAHAVTKDR